MAQFLPAYQFPTNAMLNFKPLANAIGEIGTARREAEQESYRRKQNASLMDMRRQEFAGAQEDRQQRQRQQRVQSLAGISQMILDQPDPSIQRQWFKIVLGADPRLRRSLPEQFRNDPTAAAQFLIAEARGYQDPLARQQYQADIDYKRAQTANLQRGAGADIPDSVQALDLRAQRAGLQPGTAEYNQFMITGGRGGTSLSVGPDGTVNFEQGGTRPLTEAQSKDAVYATRGEGALPIIDRYGDALTNFRESVSSNVPFVGNYAKSAEYQQAEQAGNEFLQAILRKDTGAAITSEEVTQYGSVYLPRPGDTPEVLAQKQASRLRALAAMKAGMPPAAILAQERALGASRYGFTPNGGGGQQVPAAPAGPKVPTNGATAPQTQGTPLTATNPQTGQTIVSQDGVTWFDPQTGQAVWQAGR